MLDSNNKELEVTHDNELAYVLSRFNDDFIYTTVQESLNNRIKYYNLVNPNIVASYETIFKQMLIDYPDNQQEINLKRQEVYINILKILCDYYQLIYQDWDTYDLYTSVLYIYDFFVSNFQSIVIGFFINMIIKEKNGLYQSIIIDEDKKGIGLAYSKKVIKDSQLVVICNFLEETINNICAMDIDLHTFISVAYENGTEPTINKIKEEHLNAVISTPIDFIKTFIAPLFSSHYGTVLFSSIKLILQAYALDAAPNENINIIANN